MAMQNKIIETGTSLIIVKNNKIMKGKKKCRSMKDIVPHKNTINDK